MSNQKIKELLKAGEFLAFHKCIDIVTLGNYVNKCENVHFIEGEVYNQNFYYDGSEFYSTISSKDLGEINLYKYKKF